jgi:hypothetical protein
MNLSHEPAIRDNLITGTRGPIRCRSPIYQLFWEQRFRVGFWLGFCSAMIINTVAVIYLFPFLK